MTGRSSGRPADPRAEHLVEVLVTGPCATATATAALIQSAADGAVHVTGIVTDVPEDPPVEIGAHATGSCCSAHRVPTVGGRSPRRCASRSTQ
jgi:hypothetical protein